MRAESLIDLHGNDLERQFWSLHENPGDERGAEDAGPCAGIKHAKSPTPWELNKTGDERCGLFGREELTELGLLRRVEVANCLLAARLGPLQ